MRQRPARPNGDADREARRVRGTTRRSRNRTPIRTACHAHQRSRDVADRVADSSSRSRRTELRHACGTARSATRTTAPTRAALRRPRGVMLCVPAGCRPRADRGRAARPAGRWSLAAGCGKAGAPCRRVRPWIAEPGLDQPFLFEAVERDVDRSTREGDARFSGDHRANRHGVRLAPQPPDRQQDELLDLAETDAVSARHNAQLIRIRRGRTRGRTPRP